jgi:hypothetical protein
VRERDAPACGLLRGLRDVWFELQRPELPAKLLSPPDVDERVVQRLRVARAVPALVLRVR